MGDGGWRRAEGAICKGASIMEWMVPLEGVYSPLLGTLYVNVFSLQKHPL